MDVCVGAERYSYPSLPFILRLPATAVSLRLLQMLVKPGEGFRLH